MPQLDKTFRGCSPGGLLGTRRWCRGPTLGLTQFPEEEVLCAGGQGEPSALSPVWLPDLMPETSSS